MRSGNAEEDPNTPSLEKTLGEDGLALIRAFMKIASADDRKKVIMLAERLSRPDEQVGDSGVR
jgi:hypothetical protein